MTLNARQFHKAIEVEARAKAQAKSEMPEAHFLLTGVNNESIYFNITVKLSKTTSQQIKNLKEKTSFGLTKEIFQAHIYQASFFMNLL